MLKEDASCIKCHSALTSIKQSWATICFILLSINLKFSRELATYYSLCPWPAVMSFQVLLSFHPWTPNHVKDSHGCRCLRMSESITLTDSTLAHKPENENLSFAIFSVYYEFGSNWPDGLEKPWEKAEKELRRSWENDLPCRTPSRYKIYSKFEHSPPSLSLMIETI